MEYQKIIPSSVTVRDDFVCDISFQLKEEDVWLIDIGRDKTFPPSAM